MKDIFSVDFRDAIRKVAKRELKEKFGIKVQKDKQNKTQVGLWVYRFWLFLVHWHVDILGPSSLFEMMNI